MVKIYVMVKKSMVLPFCQQFPLVWPSQPLSIKHWNCSAMSLTTNPPAVIVIGNTPVPRHGVVFDGREHKLQEVASQIPFMDKKAVRVGQRCDWYFSKRMRIQAVSRPAEPVEAAHRVVLEGSSCDGGEQGVGEQPGGLGSALHVEGVPPIVGRAPKPFIGTPSSNWGWEAVRCAAARACPRLDRGGRHATCILSAPRTVFS